MSGTLRTVHYPFPAIYGMEKAKNALLCAIANPAIKTILIRGASGTGKTLAGRSLGQISGKNIVNIPLNVTDEQLFGCLDVEIAVKEGRMVLQEGLLMRGDHNILYMDDINLFEPRIINGVVEAVLSGKVKIERENISTSYDVDTILVATMNSSDSYLSPSILDHFDICVESEYPEDADGREEILRRNMAFESDPDDFMDSYTDAENDVRDIIAKAQSILANASPSDELCKTISGVCDQLKIDGHRGDIAAANVALTLAALDGRTDADENDITESSIMCLNHRRKIPKGRRVDRMQKVAKSSVGFDINPDEKAELLRHRPLHFTEHTDGDNSSDDAEAPVTTDPALAAEGFDNGEEPEDVISKIGETFKAVDIFEQSEAKARGQSASKGKRYQQQSSDRSGRYVGSRLTDKKNPDLAFDATVRASAPYQVKRHSENDTEMAVIIEKQDMREKIREVRSSSTFLFAVDTSGSLIIRNRMTAVKGAILSLLKEHYVKKDRVGFLTFNEKAITMLLQPSREVEVIYKMLDDLAIGRRTPLSAALQYLTNYMEMYIKKRPNDDCFVVLVTDGGANVPLDPNDEETDPLQEALGIARKINIPSVKWIVIDTEKKFDCVHHAKEFADALHATYYTLDDLRIDTYEEINLVRTANAKIM